MLKKTILAILMGALLPFGGWSQQPAPFPEFTFKSSKPPKSGSTKRITVQIDPVAPAIAAASAQNEPAAAATAGAQYDWFWETAPADLDQASPANFRRAMAVLNAPPTGKFAPVPRLADLQNISTIYGRDILIATIGTQVSPAFALAVISVESGGDPMAQSNKGAIGLMQLVPATAERFNVDATLPTQNIQGGVTYLNWLLGNFDGDPILALAGYNAGENAVLAHNGVPPYVETRTYIPKVLAAWKTARGLCKTPPELFSDGCVFVGGG